jgi:hypothetical protein
MMDVLHVTKEKDNSAKVPPSQPALASANGSPRSPTPLKDKKVNLNQKNKQHFDKGIHYKSG